MTHQKCGHGVSLHEECAACEKLFGIMDRREHRIAELEAITEEARKALENVEWFGDRRGNPRFCIACNQYEWSGHRADCPVGNALAKLEGK